MGSYAGDVTRGYLMFIPPMIMQVLGACCSSVQDLDDIDTQDAKESQDWMQALISGIALSFVRESFVLGGFFCFL